MGPFFFGKNRLKRLNTYMLKFTNIKLADGKSGADRGQGLKRTEGHYVTGSGYGIGTTANSTVNDDYYIVYNQWPSFDGSAAAASLPQQPKRFELFLSSSSLPSWTSSSLS